MDEEQLISLVRNNEHLYNKFSKDYKLVHKKKKTWTKIARAMGQSEEICIKRWTSLRDRYVKDKRLADKESGRCFSLVNKYVFPHTEALKFLDQYVTPRPNRRYKKIKQNVSLPKVVEIAPMPIDSTQLSSPIQDENILSNNSNSEDPVEPYKIWCEALETFKNVCKSREEIYRKEEERNEVLYSFEKMIVAVIGSLSIMKQAQAMQQVADVVMKIKMETQTELDEIINEFIED